MWLDVLTRLMRQQAASKEAVAVAAPTATATS
jgi:hypothetical protein